MAESAVSKDEFLFYYEKLLHQVFRTAAVIPSIQRGLINNDGITLSGDGTCVHTHASSYGHKTCRCSDYGENRCNCPRHYSDPDAHWGWDSDPGTYYFGYTLYMLSYRDGQLGIDLPLHIRFLDARRHDSVSGIATLKEFRGLNPDIPVQSMPGRAQDGVPGLLRCPQPVQVALSAGLKESEFLSMQRQMIQLPIRALHLYQTSVGCPPLHTSCQGHTGIQKNL